MTTTHPFPSSVSAAGDARPLSPVADTTNTNVIPLIAQAVLPRIAAVFSPFDLCACGGERRFHSAIDDRHWCAHKPVVVRCRCEGFKWA